MDIMVLDYQGSLNRSHPEPFRSPTRAARVRFRARFRLPLVLPPFSVRANRHTEGNSRRRYGATGLPRGNALPCPVFQPQRGTESLGTLAAPLPHFCGTAAKLSHIERLGPDARADAGRSILRLDGVCAAPAGVSAGCGVL